MQRLDLNSALGAQLGETQDHMLKLKNTSHDPVTPKQERGGLLLRLWTDNVASEDLIMSLARS